MDPHLHGQQPDAFDGRERLFSGQRGRGGVLRPSQAGVLPQAQLRGRLDGRVHQHAQRLHGLVPGQADQDGVRHEHHGSSTRARSCGMIGGDGINDESNKTAPAPTRNTDLTKNTPEQAGPVADGVRLPVVVGRPCRPRGGMGAQGPAGGRGMHAGRPRGHGLRARNAARLGALDNDCFASIFLKQFLHYFSAVWAAGFQQELHHMTVQTRTGTGPPCLYIPET